MKKKKSKQTTKIPTTKLTKEQIFVCEMIWGCVPLDIDWVIQSKPFIEGMKKIKNGEWDEIKNITP